MAPPRVRVLSEQTINKIAAGEVIENPASVIKELVENSLDAGASTLCVEIQGGGRQLIRVSDDGCGMSQDDALLCLERHATSKIREIEDIEDVLTMGFRGEAIPSIASISKFNLLTCPRHDDPNKQNEGTLVIVDGGRIVSCARAARSPGTTIEVKSLFFNVPVRRKFQKSPSYDVQEIQKMLGMLALGYPSVQFELISDQKTIFKTIPPLQPLSFIDTLRKRIECILGSEYAAPLMPFRYEHPPYDLEGYIAPPSVHRPNRGGQHLFINNRAVYSHIISAAVREGFGTMLPTQRFPAFIMHLRLPGNLVDVNVHPQKKEVRLRKELQLKDAVIEAIQKTLRQQQSPSSTFSVQVEDHKMEDAETAHPQPPFWGPYASLLSPLPKKKFSTEDRWEFHTSTPILPTETEKQNVVATLPPAQINPAAEQLAGPTLFNRQEDRKFVPRVLTTLVGYFIIEPFELEKKLLGAAAAKREGGLALVDQRAAYSRIRYEMLLKQKTDHSAVQLLVPLTLQLSPSEGLAVRDCLDQLNCMGFGLREFSENTFMIDAHPPFIKQAQLQNCLTMLIQDLMEIQGSRYLQKQREEKLAWAACKASLPAAKRLSTEEAEGLLKQLINCDLPAQCPMGRPTCAYFTSEEMGKWF